MGFQACRWKPMPLGQNKSAANKGGNGKGGCMKTQGILLSRMLFALLMALGLSLPMAQAQNFQVIHTFTGGQDGATPEAGLTLDSAGNLYGTAFAGGNSGYGTIYQLKHIGSGWTFHPLYSFAGNGDGSGPVARVVFGPDGALYGTTNGGGNGYGTVFKVQPAASACKSALCPWTEHVIYPFSGSPDDGALPGYGDLVFDASGTMYNTTMSGGTQGIGTAYAVTPSGVESVIHNFTVNFDGTGDLRPYAGLAFDANGNLYGTTVGGTGRDPGPDVFVLTPLGRGEWSERRYCGLPGRSAPLTTVVFDHAGNFYGTTSAGGGFVFESFECNSIQQLSGTRGPIGGSLVLDATGNLYGTTCGDGAHSLGNVFKLTPSDGNWVYTSLYDFTGGNDGSCPYGTVSIDADGNLYGTAARNGSQGYGTVWEITP
jgi:uncharacterized repeat protein (TIGR03803 family)